jgi:tetratricopeptide (TPR) repeat protein
MYQKDYILRMIEMLGDLIAAVFGLMRKGDFQQATEKLERIYYDILKEDAAFFRSIPKEDLTHELLEKHNYTNGHLEILAELFNAEAELASAQGNYQDCLEYSEKALLLFEFIDIQQKTLSMDRLDKMTGIRDRILKLRKPKIEI